MTIYTPATALGDKLESDVKNHEEYFWDCVTFIVQNKSFSLPRQPFVRGSQAFALAHGLGNYGVSEDTLDSCIELEPIVLSDVTVEEFVTLLKLMFPTFETSHSTTLSISKEEWFSILKLSTLWHFVGYRKMAIEHLEGQVTDPLELIKYGREYAIPHWLAMGYDTLVERSQALTEDLWDQVGLRVALKLFSLRETRSKPASPVSASTTTSLWELRPGPTPPPAVVDTGSSISTNVDEVFREELEKLQEKERQFWTQEERDEFDTCLQEKLEKEEGERNQRLEEESRAGLRLEIEKARQTLEELEDRERCNLQSVDTAINTGGASKKKKGKK